MSHRPKTKYYILYITGMMKQNVLCNKCFLPALDVNVYPLIQDNHELPRSAAGQVTTKNTDAIVRLTIIKL